MRMTQGELERLLYRRVSAALSGRIGGGVYRRGMRPYDSRSEDCVVSVTALTAGQTQSGQATVSVWVPALAGGEAGGRNRPDLRRSAELQGLLAGLPEAITGADLLVSAKGMAIAQEGDADGELVLPQLLTFRVPPGAAALGGDGDDDGQSNNGQ